VARVNAKGPQEAANGQALSTRQSIAVPALSLANQSQQSVLQLLR
jgi:flagellin